MLWALVYLHALGIVYHNLKPENILFCRADSYELKLIDFGLSKIILATGDFLKSGIGTSYYVAPEVSHHN